jgi:hypothetical protein
MQVCTSTAKPAFPTVCRHEPANNRRSTVVNANYEKVMATLDRLLSEERFMGACRCAKCLDDMAALALNCLQPHYYVDAGRGGEVGSPSVLVENAVIEAMDTVGNNPRHY